MTTLRLKTPPAKLPPLVAEAADRAEAERALPIPGYTHIQRAVLSSGGMWWSGWAEAFIDDAVRARDTLALIDGSDWYLLRVSDQQQVTILRKVYPSFATVEFPDDSTQTVK